MIGQPTPYISDAILSPAIYINGLFLDFTEVRLEKGIGMS